MNSKGEPLILYKQSSIPKIINNPHLSYFIFFFFFFYLIYTWKPRKLVLIKKNKVNGLYKKMPKK